MKNEGNLYASGAQLVLARLYGGVAVIGLSLIAVMFALYVSGLAETRVPAAEVASYWHLDAETYAEETGTPVGWEFLRNLAFGESLSFGSLIFMALAVIICLAVMVVTFMKSRNLAFAAVVLLQIVVLVVAATGLISAH